jgi:membrane protein implicated in regulation of membrane protease activity
VTQSNSVAAWLIWLIAAGALLLGEIATAGLFVLGPIGVAAGGAALAAAVGAPVWLQLVVFIAATAATLALLRPLARRRLHAPPELRTGTAALVGSKAVVVERVDATGGRIRLGGELWSARAYLDDAVIEPGAHVDVIKIEGATALVHE